MFTRNTFITILLTVCCLQQVHAQNRVGLVGGSLYARSNLTNQNQSAALSQSSTTFGNIYSFYGGIVYDIKITSEFSIKSRLLYINKGWTETKDQRRDSTVNISSLNIETNRIPVEFVSSKETYKLGYLELPLDFTFYKPVGKSLLAFGVGPYISFGLSGRYNFKAISSKKSIRSFAEYPYDSANVRLIQRISVIKDTTDYLPDDKSDIGFEGSGNSKAAYTANQFDYGASIEASIEFRFGLSVNAGYTAGITNVITNRYGVIQNRHRVIMLGLGYYLKTKRKNGQ